MIPNFIAAVAGLAASYVFVWALLWFTQDAREPPIVENAVPFLSPIITMVRKWTDVHEYLRSVVV